MNAYDQIVENMLNSTYGINAQYGFTRNGKDTKTMDRFAKEYYAACKNVRRHVMNGVPDITKVIFNPPATIVYWADNTKTVVKAQGEDDFNPEVGLAMAISKKALGNTGSYYNTVKKWVGEYEESQKKDVPEFLNKRFTTSPMFARNALEFDELAKIATESPKAFRRLMDAIAKSDPKCQ